MDLLLFVLNFFGMSATPSIFARSGTLSPILDCVGASTEATDVIPRRKASAAAREFGDRGVVGCAGGRRVVFDLAPRPTIPISL